VRLGPFAHDPRSRAERAHIIALLCLQSISLELLSLPWSAEVLVTFLGMQLC